MRTVLKGILGLAVLAAGLAIWMGYDLYRRLDAQLPDPQTLREVEFQTPLEIYSHDGQLLASFGDKKRIPVTIDQVPETMIQAFLAAEDARFYQHPGVDIQGLARAAWELIRTGHKRQGGSTITMQVARNFFLSPEKTYERKLKEILLALKIERRLTKAEILELYLNKIYLGHHAYGVAAAAQIYYGKPLDRLDLAQTAMIAGLPKAPSRFNPVSNPQRARQRRDYVLKRMYELGFIDEQQYRQATARPITAALHNPAQQIEAPYAAEWIREQLYRRYGEEIYTRGYRVISTIDLRKQRAAEAAVHHALHAYDERHGYRGPEDHIEPHLPLERQLERLRRIKPIGATVPALVLAIDEAARSARLLLADGDRMDLPWDGIRWARKALPGDRLGAAPHRVDDVLQPGDVIRIRRDRQGHWRLAQIPQVQGALLSLDSRDGAVRAMVGGYDFSLSKFNRTVQSQRQPGSGFKPVLYTAALEAGYTLASVINDAPIVYRDGEMAWRPENYSGKFYGPTRLRVALRHSRNLVSVRLLQSVGLDRVIQTALKFGFRPEQLPRTPTLALGSGSASLWDMGRLYAVFANGGYRIEPYLIERIERRDGTVLRRARPLKACDLCPNSAPRILEPRIHYLMHSLLQDVIQRGTAVKARRLGRHDLAGKTGTTNDQRDAWFNGYAPPLVAITWVGFDSVKPLGRGETGSRAALPMWIEYMRVVLKDLPETAFPRPAGLVTARIDPYTGYRSHSRGAIGEIFREEFLPPYRTESLQTGNDHADSLLNSLF